MLGAPFAVTGFVLGPGRAHPVAARRLSVKRSRGLCHGARPGSGGPALGRRGRGRTAGPGPARRFSRAPGRAVVAAVERGQEPGPPRRVDRLHAHLLVALPDRPAHIGVVHGDYRIDNTLLDASRHHQGARGRRLGARDGRRRPNRRGPDVRLPTATARPDPRPRRGVGERPAAGRRRDRRGVRPPARRRPATTGRSTWPWPTSSWPSSRRASATAHGRARPPTRPRHRPNWPYPPCWRRACGPSAVPEPSAWRQASRSSRRSSAVSAADSAAPSSTTRANRSRLRSCRATTFSSMVSRETIR